MLTEFEYSPKEFELISYFGYADVAYKMAPRGLYLIMMEKAFMDDDRTSAAESLRRIMQQFGKINRMTPEWDALIEVPKRH